MGKLDKGQLRLGTQNVLFKDTDTGKLQTISIDDIEGVKWIHLATKPGVKLIMKDGNILRFGGFKDSDLQKVKTFVSSKWDMSVEEAPQCLKGWNYGKAAVRGQSLEFEVDDKPCFEIPLSNVSNCTAAKQEATLEFHINEDCPLSLIEMRFHMPQDPEAGDMEDRVEEFRQAVMQYAGVEVEGDQHIVQLDQILCLTPRGRYDIKVFPTYLSFHGKTYDYKIPFKTVTRMFLLPHKDGRHMYFVLNINPPIRQGQTRYPYVTLEFSKDEYIEQLDLLLTEEQLKEQYNGKLDTKMKGLLYEIVAKIFRVLVNLKIIVPGGFNGASGTPAVTCTHKNQHGFLYPLEKGFIYVYKPPMYIRFEEISNVHFARSDVSTRTFDFEILLKSGHSFVFNNMEKEEYNKLYDFVNAKGLIIRNANRLDKPKYKEDVFAGSDDDIDPYKEGLKAEARKKGVAAESESDSEDEDFDPEKAQKKGSSDESDGSDEEDSDEMSEEATSESEPETKKKKPEKKPKKEKSEKAGTSKTKKGKKDKDPNAPKRATTAYMIWFNENRTKIQKEGDSVADTARRAGKLWKEMGDAEKKPYDEKAKKDKERYEREMKDYKASGGGSAAPSSSKSKSKVTSSPQKNAKSREFIEESDSSSEEEKEKPTTKKQKTPESSEESEESDDSD
uniref:FACT complex subunit SSRP1 n=1 Tax=Acrobeloides nanus TaxID=290746 RepID=A0A914CW44_9BILA